MSNLREAFIITGWNLYTLRKNPRFYMSLLLGFLLCWLLTDKTMSISRTYMTNVQIFEPFIWCYADADSILYASLVMMFLFSAFPRTDTAAAYLIFRARRSSWLLGQVFTTCVLTFLYCFMILVSSMLLCLGNAFFENHWSETATMLSFSPASFEVALTVMRKTVKLTTPYECAVQIFFLLFSYVLLLAMLQLTFAVFKSRKTGICVALIVNFAGFVLTPARFMLWLNLPPQLEYYANLLSAWVSPLQHATYTMHNFGYDLLPRLHVSYALFGGITIALFALSAFAARRFSFDFSGGYGNE
jgi:hypothetical protein